MKKVLKVIVYILLFICLGCLFLILPKLFEKIMMIMFKSFDMDLRNSYLAFYGALISGLFTVLGVVMTLKHENKLKREDDSITYKPILVIDDIDKKVNCIVRNVGFRLPGTNTKESFFRYRLLLKNKGRGETFNAVLENAEVCDVSWDQDNRLYYFYSQNQYIGEVLKDEYIGIDIELPNYLFMPKDIKDNNYRLITCIILNYCDMFNRVKYQYKVYTTYDVVITDRDKNNTDPNNPDLIYSKVVYGINGMMPEKLIYSKKENKFIHEEEFYRKSNKEE